VRLLFGLERQQDEAVLTECTMAGIRNLKIAVAAFALFTTSVFAQQPRPHAKPTPIKLERAADSYAIYSLLMPGVPFSAMSPAQAPRLAIAGTTVNINDMNPAVPPEGQLQPPPNNEKAFQEAVQDFHTRRYERVQFEHEFKLDRPYTLLSADDITELKKNLAGIDPGSQLQDKWAGYPGITYFSEVYFNTAHTAALVYMNNFCANLCSNGQWIYLEKNGDQWVRRSGLNI
jgi:hypothetical protein